MILLKFPYTYPFCKELLLHNRVSDTLSKNFNFRLRDIKITISYKCMFYANRVICIIFKEVMNMILTNIESVPGMTITAQYGLVTGSTVRAKNAIKDFGAGLKNMVGGELKSYTELLTEARKEAVQRMETQAMRLGANAIINVRFATSSVTVGAAEVYAYGTAVKVQPKG